MEEIITMLTKEMTTLSKRMEDALNSQLNRELYSAYLYMSMAAFFESQNFEGMANWMKVQSNEEMTHAMRFYNYILNRNGRVILTPIEGPQTEWGSPLHVFENSYQHEREITKFIYNLVDLSLEEKDHTTNVFLDWFITEQAEEEMSVSRVVEKIKLMKDAPGAMFMLDAELAKRTFTPGTGTQTV